MAVDQAGEQVIYQSGVILNESIGECVFVCVFKRMSDKVS